MLQGYYSAASGMSAALQNQDALAQNLAHAPVPGYRRQGLCFAEHMAVDNSCADVDHCRAQHGATPAQFATSFAPGPYR
jgi:flagellar basal body rod protein FlgG